MAPLALWVEATGVLGIMKSYQRLATPVFLRAEAWQVRKPTATGNLSNKHI
jgi:hypothetical protein